MEKSKVAIAECNKYDYDLIKDTLLKMIDNTSFPPLEGKSVLVKPNILSDAPSNKNITTNPIVVKAVIDIVKERGAKEVYCGDSPGLPSSTFKGKECGIWDVVQDSGAIWVDFSDNPIQQKGWNNITFPQARILTECDVVISVAKMKTHQLMYTTGAVKNMFGTVPGLNKSPMHLKARNPESFAHLLLSIYRTHIPEYSIMDAIVSMEGAGPANGTLRQTNLLLSSSSALALDKAEAIIMGYEVDDIPLLRVAEKEEKGILDSTYPLLNPYNLIIKDFRRVEVKKRGLFSSLLLPYLRRRNEKRESRKRLTPFFDIDKCKRCLKCVEICPAKALKKENNKIVLDEKKCIRCYCCHEMCPFDAILIKKN